MEEHRDTRSVIMGQDGLDCDIQNILECRENEEFDLLQRLSTFCQDFHSRTAVSIETCLAREKEYEQKQAAINEQIAQLHRVNKDKITELDNVVLQQKVTDKKMAIATSQQAKLREEINDAKLRKESISLQMVDLAQEIEDARKLRKDRWNAIKKACLYYKENLDIHIGLEQCNDHDNVKVTFFQRKNPQRDDYYVILENYKNAWKVGHIEPTPKETHLERIKAIIDFTKTLDVPDVMAFLCTLRNVFSKHYSKE